VKKIVPYRVVASKRWEVERSSFCYYISLITRLFKEHFWRLKECRISVNLLMLIILSVPVYSEQDQIDPVPALSPQRERATIQNVWFEIHEAHLEQCGGILEQFFLVIIHKSEDTEHVWINVFVYVNDSCVVTMLEHILCILAKLITRMSNWKNGILGRLNRDWASSRKRCDNIVTLQHSVIELHVLFYVPAIGIFDLWTCLTLYIIVLASRTRPLWTQTTIPLLIPDDFWVLHISRRDL